MMMRKLALLTSVDDQNFDSAVGWGKKWANKIWGSRYYNVFIPRPSKFPGNFHKSLNSVLRFLPPAAAAA